MDRENKPHDVRERLKDVHATDLTESKVNQDFLDWLKSKGPSWLLFFLIAVCAYLGIIKWRQSRANYRNEAWVAYAEAQLPESLQEVASKYADVDGIRFIARMNAAEQIMRTVQAGQEMPDVAGGDELATPQPIPLTTERREELLTQADRIFTEIIDETTGSTTPGMALYATSAMSGKAAIAESRGDADAARQWYEKAAAAAQAFYPKLAASTQARVDSVDENIHAVHLSTTTAPPSSPMMPTDPTKQPVILDPALRDLVLPSPTGG